MDSKADALRGSLKLKPGLVTRLDHLRNARNRFARSLPRKSRAINSFGTNYIFGYIKLHVPAESDLATSPYASDSFPTGVRDPGQGVSACSLITTRIGNKNSTAGFHTTLLC